MINDSPVTSLRAFFEPSSVAVIGASRTRGTIGGELFHNLIAGGFRGSIVAVNPATKEVQGCRSYASIDDVPEPIDLAVVVMPAAHVLPAIEGCARKQVKAVVIISAGFAETGPEGKRQQQLVLDLCRKNGMRLIGPNCLGIANTDPEVRLHATFAPHSPPFGRVAMLTQSGALGLALIDYAGKLGLGLSTFVSYGNKADVSVNDLLEYWEDDSKTDVILLYLESFGNPRKFSKIAPRVSRQKPIVALKSGRSLVGARAASSHTGALLAASDMTTDALFRQAGVIRCDTLEEFFDVASFLAHQPVPQGNRVAIVTNVGGPGIMCADACDAAGLIVPELSAKTQSRLREIMPPEASVKNPVDLVAAADFERFKKSIEIIEADEAIDSVIAIFIPPIAHTASDTGKLLYQHLQQRKAGLPTALVFMSADGVQSQGSDATQCRVPVYTFPEPAARAIAKAAQYGKWRMLEDCYQRPAETDRACAQAIIKKNQRSEATWLGPEDINLLLGAYGIPFVHHRLVSTVAEAESAAAAFGGMVALKAWGPEIVHKTELGAVQLNLDRKTIGSKLEAMRDRLTSQGKTASGFIVEPMIPGGVEMFVGVVHEANFGAVLACGAGGVTIELVKDVQVSLTPLSQNGARELLGRLKTFPLLTGYRGSALCDLDALVDLIVRIGTLADDLPQIAEIDFNPIRVGPAGVTIVDARVLLRPA